MPMLHNTWLSFGAETLAARLQCQREDEFDCDVLIVGSGYGGAVAAARLAGALVQDEQRPARVWLAERGLEHLPGHFPSTFSELPGQVRFGLQDGRAPRGRDEGLFDLRLGGIASVVVGNGLGGGSLINASVMLQPPAQVFAEGWPQAIRDAAADGSLDAAYDRARAMLGPRAIARPPRKFEVFRRCAAQAGVQVDAAPIAVNLGPAAVDSAAGVAMPPCTQCGDCVTGCNQGAKGSLDTNYLAWARARGVEMFCGVAVERLRQLDAGHWAVDWHYTERRLRPADGDDWRPLRARHVVLAAGALGSTEILMRSGAAGLVLSPRLGEGFSTNGDCLAAGVGHAEKVGAVADPQTDPADAEARWVGPTITGKGHVPGPAPFTVQEFAVPAALRSLLGEVAATTRALPDFGGANAPTGTLRGDRAVVTPELVDTTSVYGLMGDDGARGWLGLPDVATVPVAHRAVEGGIRIQGWDKAQNGFGRVSAEPVFTRMADWLQRAVAPAQAALSSRLLLGRSPAITVHPLGGCRMADTAQSGVVDALGRVFAAAEGSATHGTLAVLDGAIVARSLGVNPALTIAALAELALPRLMPQWGLAPGVAAAQPWPARPIARRQEQVSAETVWTIRERMQGPAELGGQHFWARLDTEFEPIPGLRKALTLSQPVVGVRRAQLTLHAQAARPDEFSMGDDPGPAVCTAQLTGSIALFVPLPTPPATAGVDQRIALNYRLQVASLSGSVGAGLRVGARLDGRKLWGERWADAGGPRSDEIAGWSGPLRQLTEMDLRLDGQPLGRWTLDLGHLAEQRDPLLSLSQLSAMPDALDDLLAIGLYGVRRALAPVGHMAGPLLDGSLDTAMLSQRWPGPLADGTPSEVQLRPVADDPAGWRLSRYRVHGGAPVLLIHGLGTSGSSFTHASIGAGRSLAAHLRDQGRDVWVLDLRSSIGNEAARALPASRDWTVDEIARDIPQAVAAVCRATGAASIDVVAHCMGAVMFILAALDDTAGAMRGKVRRAVLSQVGPRARLSPMNRLRGYVGSYLQRYLQIEELDATPDESDPRSNLLGALLVAAFPYSDDEHAAEAAKAADPVLEGSNFRLVRRRADAIFGQLFDAANLGAQTLLHLPALLGWVKVPMLAQAIHFARLDMLTSARGRNTSLRQDNFRSRFDFPVLMLHGRNNRVFDWRGSLRSLRLLERLRRQPRQEGRQDAADGLWRWGAGTSTQLVVFDAYGHLDCLIGERAHAEVFPEIDRFLGAAELPDLPSVAGGEAPTPPFGPEVESPWLGPLLGWLRWDRDGQGRPRLRARVVVHTRLQRATTTHALVIPMSLPSAGGRLNLASARSLRWVDADAPSAAFDLAIDPVAAEAASGVFALLTLHDDLPLDAEPLAEASGLMGALPLDLSADSPLPLESAMRDRRALDAADAWLAGSAPLTAQAEAAAARWIASHHDDGELARCLLHLHRPVIDAADLGEAATEPAELRIALASCQYPPGLLDRWPADATWRRLASDAAMPDGPQCLLLAGDQVYVDDSAGVFDPVAAGGGGAAATAAAFDRVYEQSWSLPGLRACMARLPTYPMLDDHEVHDFWQGTAADPAVAELTAYDRFQAPLVVGAGLRLGGAGSRSLRLHPAGVPLWLLDTRSGRDRRLATDLAAAQILPRDVMDQLKHELGAAPRHSVKLVLSPVPLLPPERFAPGRGAERLRSDTWAGFPAALAELLCFIRDRDVRRVVFLSGDSHLSSVCTFALDSAHPNQVVSVVSSGAYTPWPFANQRPDELVTSGPVDLGTPEVPCGGTLTLLSMSAASGYAQVGLQPVPGGAAVQLRVSLRAGDGSTADCAPILLE
jgi:choline dehydrogenase-like flavoprotein